MEASSQRAWQDHLTLMLMLGVVAASACVAALMWWNGSAASAQDAGEPSGPDASFVVRCDYTGERKKDDPIVSPGVESFHMHDFFGNTTTNRNSTLKSLRAGGTTCLNPGDESAYWIPTVKWTDSTGTRTLEANRGLFYYRAGGKDDDAVELYPDGLKVVTVQGSNVTWKCEGDTDVFSSPPSRCSSGKLVLRVVFPDCLAEASNGQPLLDSADHRSHMAYAVTQSDGTMECPSTHPKPVPALTMNVRFPIPTTSGTVRLSSDDQGDPPGSTMHADFFNAWEKGALTGLIDRCIKAAPFTASNPKPSECKLIN
jgi:Domain of unknown function (DUF1996)